MKEKERRKREDGRKKSLIIALGPLAAKTNPPAGSARARIRRQLSTSAAASAKRRADRRAATSAKPLRSAAGALKTRCFGGLRDLRRAQLSNALSDIRRAGCCAFAAPRASGCSRSDAAAPRRRPARGCRAGGSNAVPVHERRPGFRDRRLAKQGAKCTIELMQPPNSLRHFAAACRAHHAPGDSATTTLPRAAPCDLRALSGGRRPTPSDLPQAAGMRACA